MNKLRNLLDNIVVIWDLFKDYPKRMTTLLLLIISFLWVGYHRAGEILSCYKVAWYEQGVALEDFEFKLLTGTCVVKRSDGRWLPVNRVIDVPDAEVE